MIELNDDNVGKQLLTVINNSKSPVKDIKIIFFG